MPHSMPNMTHSSTAISSTARTQASRMVGSRRVSGRAAALLLPLFAALCITVHTALGARPGTCLQSSTVLSNTLKPVVFPVQVDFESSGPRSVCYSTLFLDCSNPPTCTNRTTWRWIYGATDKYSCEYLDMEAGGGAYRNVTCCSTNNCNAPNATFDRETIILPSDPAQG